jgi:hypothetical protein
MNTQTLSPSNLRKKGLQALHKSLGPVGMVRFLQQFEEGTGDYTRDRKQLLTAKSVAEVAEKIKRARKQPSTAP